MQSYSCSDSRLRDKIIKAGPYKVELPNGQKLSWKEIDNVDWACVNKVMQSPKIIYDGRNSLDPDLIRSHNFEYVSIGKR